MKKSSFINLLLLLSIVYPQSNLTNDFNYKYDKCLKTGRVLGVVGGGTMGLAYIYWSANNMTNTSEPLWKNIVAGVPSSLRGGYGGTFGATIGLVYGPSLSIYMKF